MATPADNQTHADPSRRRFLAGSVVAATAAALPAISVAAASSPTAIVPALSAAIAQGADTETPELLAIASEMPAAEQRYAAAVEALEIARETALRMAPPIPEGLPVPFGISIFGQVGWHGLGEPCNILGGAVELPRYTSPKSGKQLPVRIPTADDILKDRRSHYRLTGIPAWHRGEHRRLYDLAVRFERELDEAREASGLNQAEFAVWRSTRDIVLLCDRASNLEATSIAGLLVKAQAIMAAAAFPNEGHSAAVHGANRLPEAICRVLAVQS